MKLVILDGHAVNPGDLSWDGLRAFGEVQVYAHTAPSDTVAHIGDAQLVLTNKTVISAEILGACPQIRYIGVLATGYNVVDLSAAAARGIAVTNIPAYSTRSVAQFTFALLLELCHHVGEHDRSVHAGDWSACPDFCYWNTPQIALEGKTLGIYGFGRIGRAVAAIAPAFGMRVLVYSRHPDAQPDADVQFVDADTLLSQSDVVSLHCPLTDETRRLINHDTLARMKDGAMLINTARGPLIDEAALRDALRSGKLAGAAVDVADSEPLPADSPLLDAPRCIITPHIAWAPLDTRRRLLEIAVQNVDAFVRGERLNRVEAPAP